MHNDNSLLGAVQQAPSQEQRELWLEASRLQRQIAALYVSLAYSTEFEDALRSMIAEKEREFDAALRNLRDA